jgi:hypothetical protein
MSPSHFAHEHRIYLHAHIHTYTHTHTHTHTQAHLSRAFRAWMTCHIHTYTHTNRHMSRAMRAWMARSARKRRLRSGADKCVRRLRMRAIVPSFVTWCDNAREAKRQAQITRGIVVKWIQRSIGRAWEAVSVLCVSCGFEYISVIYGFEYISVIYIYIYICHVCMWAYIHV